MMHHCKLSHYKTYNQILQLVSRIPQMHLPAAAAIANPTVVSMESFAIAIRVADTLDTKCVLKQQSHAFDMTSDRPG